MIMRTLRVVGILMACAMPAFGQTPPAAPSRDDLQPGVNTSAMPPQPTTQGQTSSTAAAAAPAKPAAASAPAAAGSKATHPAKAQDRLELDATQITGNKELPKVMYVVPWKRSDLGDLTGKPANSLVDEVLQPVDRDVFNREERYYHTVAAQKGVPEPAAGAPPGH
jgi:predicted lipid-binding transport protein (Tim44 family)